MVCDGFGESCLDDLCHGLGGAAFIPTGAFGVLAFMAVRVATFLAFGSSGLCCSPPI